MTTLKNLKGTAIQFLDADPVVYIGAWSSGGDLNTARESGGGTPQGTQNAALYFSGSTGSPSVLNESYNGTSWTEVGDLNTTRYFLGGIGTQTSALAFGGYGPPGNSNASEEWNGSSWTEGNDLSTARYAIGGFGIQTAALAFGGDVPPNTGKQKSGME